MPLYFNWKSSNHQRKEKKKKSHITIGFQYEKKLNSQNIPFLPKYKFEFSNLTFG